MAAAGMVALFAVCNNVLAATSWTDYFSGTAPTSGKVTIAAGDEVVINDSEMETSKACTVTVAEGATLKFNTSTFPSFALGSSLGTVEKVYSGDWLIATINQGSFKGTYVISSGTVNINGTYYKVFGGVDALDTATLYATNGTTIAYNGGASRLRALPMHLGGSMTFSKATFANPIFQFLTLEGDSTLTAPEAAKAFVDQFDADHPAFIDLNGHDLTIGGVLDLTLKNGSFTGSGGIKVGAGTSSKAHILHLENFGMENCTSGDVLELEQYSGVSTTTPLAIPRKVKVDSMAVKFPGPGWTTFAGGLDGEDAVVSAFVTNVVGEGMVSFPGRTIADDTLSVGSYSNPDAGALWIGHSATGGLWIAEGMALTNKLMVGGINNGKKYQIGCGTVRQTGGEICMIGTSDDTAMRSSSTIGWSAHGYYELTNGVTRVPGSFIIGMASPGVVAQYGGVFEQVSHPLTPSTTPIAVFSLAANDTDAQSIPSAVYVGGGTMRLGQVFMTHGKTSESVITVTGTNSLLETPERIYVGFKEGSTAWVNINDGGVLATPYILYRFDVDAPSYVNFDGGTLRAMPAVPNSSALNNIFGYPGGSVPLVTRVTVGPRGAAIDTAGRNMQTDVSMSAPYGNVVASIPFAAEAGWTVAPYVKIVDDGGEGAGATAFADFDSATGTLNGFRVTSGGWNYTSAKARLYVNKTMVREIECVMQQAPASGSFTKKGEGQLLLAAANSWAGDTVIERGTLKAGCAGAFPSGSRIVMAGGKVEVASGVDFPSELTIAMDLDDSQTYVLSDNFTGGSLPSISGVSASWKAVASGGKLLLKYRRGFTLIMR